MIIKRPIDKLSIVKNEIFVNGCVDTNFLNTAIDKIEMLDNLFRDCAKENNIELKWCQLDNDSDQFTLYCMIEAIGSKKNWNKCWNKWTSHKDIISDKNVEIEINPISE